MNNETDSKAIDLKYKSPIMFLGKKRELARTNKRISNKIVYLLKKEAYMNSNMVDYKKYEELSQEWLKEAGALVKQIISPITKKELEEIDVQDLEVIQDAIDRRKYRARGYTDEEINDLERAGRKAIISQARMMLDEDTRDVDSEDFQTMNTE